MAEESWEEEDPKGWENFIEADLVETETELVGNEESEDTVFDLEQREKELNQFRNQWRAEKMPPMHEEKEKETKEKDVVDELANRLSHFSWKAECARRKEDLAQFGLKQYALDQDSMSEVLIPHWKTAHLELEFEQATLDLETQVAKWHPAVKEQYMALETYAKRKFTADVQKRWKEQNLFPPKLKSRMCKVPPPTK